MNAVTDDDATLASSNTPNNRTAHHHSLEGARLELETASEAFRNWQNENSKLRFDCERLEGALDSAFTTIGGWRTEADPAAWLRRGALQWREREAARDRAAVAGVGGAQPGRAGRSRAGIVRLHEQ